MQTAQIMQLYDKKRQPQSPATCIESLYFEQTYNGQVYRTSLNNRLLVVGNRLNMVSKENILESLNNAMIPYYYITKIESDTASGLYRLDVSLYSINTAVRSTQVIDDISTDINNKYIELNNLINQLDLQLQNERKYNTSTYLLLTGGKMSGGIVWGSKNSTVETNKLPGIGYNGQNLILACPNEDSYISLWGSLSEEYGLNQLGTTWKKPGVNENGKVPVYNYANSQLVWSTYNAGSLKYSNANYSKYYILGITEQSYQERDFGETAYIAEEGNVEPNVYVSRKNVYANAFYASSDIALKTDIKKGVDPSIYIPEVIQFKWIDTSELSYGFLAQDLEEHGLTCLMEKDDEDHWRVNYNAAIALVVGDLQKKEKTYKEQITNLKQENDNLKQMINEISERLSKIEKS